MKFKGNLSLEWYQKHKSITLSPLTDSSCPPMLNWVNKDGALFYEIDASQARGLRPVWTSASDYRVREARPLEFVRRFEFAGNFMAPECKTIATPKAPGLPIDENIIIRGDNLLALNTLVAHIEGREETDKVKCIYIDPPYNTGSAFQHYDDNLEHSIWLTMMRDRLILMRRLLREDGVIFISCDDREQAYLKIMCDEIFGREHFIATIPWRKRTAKSDVPFGISQDYEWILAYAKTALFLAGKAIERKYYQTPDFPNDRWRLSDLTTQKNNEERPNSFFTMVNPKNGKEYPASSKRTWAVSKDTFQSYYDRGKIVFPDDYKFLNIKIPAFRVFESEDKEKSLKKYGSNQAQAAVSTVLPDTVGRTEHGTEEITSLFGEKVFSFPKTETLMEWVIDTMSQPGDLVFDAFGGSGTTFAVAHKMGRRYIGIEVGEHADTLILPRLQKVIAGQDKCGISPKIGWQGGGGFSYYHLGESVLMQNTAGDWVLNRSLPAEDLQRAILRTFDAPLQKSQGGWAYGHNGAEGYLVCLEDADGNLTAEEIQGAMAQLCPTDKPYLLTGLCLSASDSELDKLLKGCYPLPYALMPQGGEE